MSEHSLIYSFRVTRAAPLPREERRRALIEATRPLLLEQGASISTRQVAEAAGIAEGTIFRVFRSKQELIDAVVADLVSPETILTRLDAVGAGPLEQVTAGLIGVLMQHAREARALFGVLRPAGPPPDAAASKPHPREDANLRILDHLQDALAPHVAELSVTPRRAAGALMSLAFGSSFAPSATLTPESVAHLLLHGIAKETAC